MVQNTESSFEFHVYLTVWILIYNLNLHRAHNHHCMCMCCVDRCATTTSSSSIHHNVHKFILNRPTTPTHHHNEAPVDSSPSRPSRNKQNYRPHAGVWQAHSSHSDAGWPDWYDCCDLQWRVHMRGWVVVAIMARLLIMFICKSPVHRCLIVCLFCFISSSHPATLIHRVSCVTNP